ncbi:hypothetical protein [Lactobacillus brevis] [Lactiplantibacillus mudanjiangensis]|uniref:AAA family ATPase n=1 Tax=Lactiplantibacillus mudanjiangensis TaxID=1296538 RepID=UPI001014E6AD|nr:AAA family ATPase [Lactiplantibacillus mudanjiangensis]VDG32761.1 hypothetical protein [Lactobacillus brevis] [Lactiplantibacillus mudanjiangensis]
MRIQNLGPIKDARIKMNRMTVLVGANGMGKTLAAYSLFAFRNWLETSFKPDVVSTKDTKKLLTDKQLILPVDTCAEKVREQVLAEFNELNSNSDYFVNFFRDSEVYVKGKTKIEIEKADVDEKQFQSNALAGSRWRLNDFNDFNNVGGLNKKNYNIVRVELDELSSSLVATYEGIEINDIDNSMINEFTSSVNGIIKEIILDPSSSFYMPAERIGINVFRTQLNNQIINDIFRNPSHIVDEKTNYVERYPYPIEAYLKFINNALSSISSSGQKQDLSLFVSVDTAEIIKRLIPGEFTYNRDTNTLAYNLSDTKEQRSELTFNLLSSSLKSLFGIDLFLKNLKEGSTLFIDEPEMNLHAARQKDIIDVLYTLIPSAINTVLSTHSDYLVKALINNMLKSKLEGHPETAESVSVYQFKDGTIEDLGDISDEQSNLDNFDATTDAINDEYYDLMEKLANKSGDQHER